MKIRWLILIGYVTFALLPSCVNQSPKNVVNAQKAHSTKTETLRYQSGVRTTIDNNEQRGTGDLGVIIQRTSGSAQLINTTSQQTYSTVKGLGDLSHASVVYSRDTRYAFVFGRDGGLTKIDLLNKSIVNRKIQAGNSFGGAISQDGKLIAVSNYEPGGVRVFNSDNLEMIADIPATSFVDPRSGKRRNSKVVGLVDAPGQKFIFSLFDTHEIWVADFSVQPFQLTKFTDIGLNPYDALITPDGRYYIAGLFGQNGLAKLDLWHQTQGSKVILQNYGKGQQKLPVYKMPHLEGWAIAANYAFVPAVGQHQVLIIDMLTWQHIKSINVAGQPVFVMARPDARQVWVNFAFPNNNQLQVIDTESQQIISTLTPGEGVLHMEFTPKGEQLWTSVRDENKVVIYDTNDFSVINKLPAKHPSGIFFTSRAHRIGL